MIYQLILNMLECNANVAVCLVTEHVNEDVFDSDTMVTAGIPSLWGMLYFLNILSQVFYWFLF